LTSVEPVRWNVREFGNSARLRIKGEFHRKGSENLTYSFLDLDKFLPSNHKEILERERRCREEEIL
jgi:hypothetical protein